MSYMDMTFCPYYKDCAKAGTCPRPLTPEIGAKAEKWWGGPDYLIGVYSAKPDCWVERKTKKG